MRPLSRTLPAWAPAGTPHRPRGAGLTLFSTEATERRFLGLLGPLLPEGIGRRLVAEAFHCGLKGPVVVDKKTLVELRGFQAVSGLGGWGAPWSSWGYLLRAFL